MEKVKIVYSVTEREGKAWWTRIGTATTNKDGSLQLKLDCFPLNGSIQVRHSEPQETPVMP